MLNLGRDFASPRLSRKLRARYRICARRQAGQTGRRRSRERETREKKERERQKDRGGRSLQGHRGRGFIAGRIARYGAMSESRVHPVISRYSFAREVTRLRENRARVFLPPSFSRSFVCLSFLLSRARAREKENTRCRASSKTPRSGGNTAVVRDFLEGERGRGYTARRNPAVTHGRIELFIVMAACSTASSLCVGVGDRGKGGASGEGGTGELSRASASAGLFPSPCPRCCPRRLSLSLSLFPSSLSFSFVLLVLRALALPVGHFGIYKYRYQALSVL